MMTSFYDLLKYAATGIASPGMTAYDKMRALAMGGGKVKTLTGVPPLSFRANGKPLISWSMLGNGQQTGTPTPDAPIMPTFCGERTINLLNNVQFYNTAIAINCTKTLIPTGVRLTSTGTDSQLNHAVSYGNTLPSYAKNACISVKPNTTYTLYLSSSPKCYISKLDSSYKATSNSIKLPIRSTPIAYNFSTDSTTAYIVIRLGNENLGVGDSYDFTDMMLVEGSEALSAYIPYGWKIPVTSAGQTQNVYLGQVQTTRKIKKVVFDGTQSVYSCGRTTDSQNYCCTFRFSDIGMTDIKDYNISMASIDYPIFLSDRFVNKGNSKRTYYHNISAGEMGANNLDGMNRYIIFCVSGLTTAEEYIDWFTNNPTTLYYILATPTTGIVNEPLAKIGGYADELHSTDAGVSIPTAKGQNTLTVDTDLKPSSMTITYR